MVGSRSPKGWLDSDLEVCRLALSSPYLWPNLSFMGDLVGLQKSA